MHNPPLPVTCLSVLASVILTVITPAASYAQAQPSPRSAARKPAPVAAPQAAPAQPPSALSELGLGLDARHLQLRDDLVAPLVHSGFTPGLGLTYAYRGADHRHEGRIGIATGTPVNRYDLDAYTYSYELDYAYGYRVYSRVDPALNLYTGARIGGAGDSAFYPRIDESHAYWFTRYDLRPQATAEMVIDSRSRAALSLSFPLFGLVSRPPDTRFYSNDKPDFGYVFGKLHEDLKFRTLNTYAGFDAGLKYRYQVTKAVAESVEYRFAYASTNEPRGIQVLTHSLRVGVHVDPWKW